MRRLTCDRAKPWGHSVCINAAPAPRAAGDGVFVLEIEMQSGDPLRIEASAFSLRNEA